MQPEVVMNLWVFIQSVGPMNVIYELGVRPYMMCGSDAEMTKLLKELAVSDFHFAHRFALPDRYHLSVTERDGMLRASSGDTMPESGGVQKGIALVRPDISGMYQMEYFKEALDVVEKTIPTRRLGIDGVETEMPRVNRKNLLTVITNVNLDINGNQVPLLPGDPRRLATPSAVSNLWLFRDDKANVICSLSGRGYMVHGTDSDKAHILKALAPHDFTMVSALPIPERFSAYVEGKIRHGVLDVSSDNSYSKDLFNDVYQAIEHEIPAKVGIDGEINNPVAMLARQATTVATQITECADKPADAVPVQVVEKPLLPQEKTDPIAITLPSANDRENRSQNNLQRVLQEAEHHSKPETHSEPALPGICPFCGKRLSLLQRLLKTKHHSNCAEVENARLETEIAKQIEDNLTGLSTQALLAITSRVMSRLEPQLIMVAPQGSAVSDFAELRSCLQAMSNSEKSAWRKIQYPPRRGGFCTLARIGNNINIVIISAELLILSSEQSPIEETVGRVGEIYKRSFAVYRTLLGDGRAIQESFIGAFVRDCARLRTLLDAGEESLIAPGFLGDIWCRED